MESHESRAGFECECVGGYTASRYDDDDEDDDDSDGRTNGTREICGWHFCATIERDWGLDCGWNRLEWVNEKRTQNWFC